MAKEISTKIKVRVFGLGFLFSLVGLLMIWALFARIINDFALDLLAGNDILILIILGNIGITFIISVIFGIVITEDVAKRSVYLASSIALLVSFIILLAVSYFGLAIIYPAVYSELEGFDVILAFPSIIMYFSIYLMGNSFWINIIFILVYYLLFLTFLDTFYEYDSEYKKYDSVFKEFKDRRL